MTNLRIAIFLTSILSLKNFIAGAQITLSKYYQPEMKVANNIKDHLKVNFKWTMKGELQALINEGINQLDENNMELAMYNLDKAIQQDSSLWMSYYYRGICFKKIGNFTRATKDLKKASQLNKQLAEAHIEIGEMYLEEKKFKEAADQFVEATEINPKRPEAYFGMANVSFLNSSSSSSRELYRKCIALDPKFISAYVMLGIIELDRFNHTGAVTEISKAIAIDSTYSAAYVWRAISHLDNNDLKSGLRDWNKLIQLNPENAFFILIRGYINIEAGDFENAFVDLKRALKAEQIDEDKFVGGQTVLDKQIDLRAAGNYLVATGYGLKENTFSNLKRAFCMMLAGDNWQALKALEDANQIEPTATGFFLGAINYEHANNHFDAYECYNRALSLDNDIFDAHKKRTVYRMEMADWKGAMEDINHLFRLQPNSPVALRLRGLVRAHQRKNADAIADFNEFLKTDTADVEVIRCRSICYTLLNDHENAIRDINWIVKKNPIEWTLNDQMVDNCLILKDTVKAISILNGYILRQPSEYLPYFKLMDILINQNLIKQAKPLIAKLNSLLPPSLTQPEYSRIYFWQGVIELESKNYELALAQFDRAIQMDENNFDAKYRRGNTFEAMGNFTRARDDYKALAKQNFKDSKSRYKALAGK